MEFRSKHRHMIDLLFPIALFLVFALSAVTLILIASGIYQSTIKNSALQYTSRTGLAYLSEKIHQSDEDGTVYSGTLGGADALVIEQQFGEDIYYTYIYVYEESLRELFIKEGTAAEAKDGRMILAVQDFSMEQIADRLFRFTCTDQEEQTCSTVIGVRSR